LFDYIFLPLSSYGYKKTRYLTAHKKNPTLTGMGSNPALLGERLARSYIDSRLVTNDKI